MRIHLEHIITIPGMNEDIERRIAENDGRWAGINRRYWEQGRRCTSPDELKPGMRVTPFDPHWRRGPGVVQEIERGTSRLVWVQFGRRPSAHPTDPEHLTVYCLWPGELTHQLSKQNLRHKDVKVMGAGWPTAMHYCTACGWFIRHTP